MNRIQGLILSVTEHKENDAIVKVLTESGVYSVYARGILKMRSKNRRLCQPFSFVELVISDSKKMPLLISGSVIQYYHKIQSNLLASSVCFVLSDSLRYTNKSFDTFLHVWHSANENSHELYFWACLLMAQTLEAEGIVPYFASCIHCSSTKVETISIEEGGFLCPSCNHGRYPVWDKEQMLRLRYIFICKEADYTKLLSRYTLSDFMFLCRWYEYHGNVRLSSIDLLKSVQAL